MFGIPQPEQHHPEIDTGIHTLMVLEQACILSSDPIVRFAALMHDLGKAKTPKDEWPRHIGHEQLGVAVIQGLCQRLRVPTKFRELACIVSEYHLKMHRLSELKNTTILKLLESTGSLRNEERAKHFVFACEADAKGRTGLENRDYPQRDLFFSYLAAANSVDSQAIAKQFDNGAAIKDAIRRARIQAIAVIKKA